MSAAVGLKDVFSYGLRFVGYLSLVVLVGGGLLVAGFAFGFSAVLGAGAAALTDPSQLVAQISMTNLVLGAVFTVAGGVTLVSGLIGILHKLVADAAMTGTEMALAAETDSEVPEVEDDDAASTPDEASPETEEPTAEPPSAQSDGTEPEAAESVEADPVSDETGSDDGIEEPLDDDPEQVTAEGGPEPEDSPEPADPEPVAEEPATASADTASNTETQLIESDAGPSESVETTAEEATDDGDLIAESDADETESADAPPEEWSPPDPSEFEFDGENRQDDGEATDTDSDASEESEDTDESPRTAADLFGESDDDESAVFESSDDQSEVAERSDDVETVETDGDADPLSDALDEE